MYKIKVKFKNGKEISHNEAVRIDFIGNLTIQGCMSKEQWVYDWENIEEIVIKCL